MSQRHQSILLPLFIVLVSAVGTLAFMIKHPRVVSEQSGSKPIAAAVKGRSGPDAVSQVPSGNEPVEVEVLTVRPSGFEPREISRRHGAFMLAISNHTGATDLALDLDRVQGNRVQEVHLPKGRIRWNKVFDLPPGDYVLSEQNHPDWICHITLTAR